MAGPVRGGGVKGRAIKEKRTFFGIFFPNVPPFQRPLSSRGGGGRPLVGWGFPFGKVQKKLFF